MFAFGAITCAHSTSRVVSSAQPTMSPFVGSKGGSGAGGLDDRESSDPCAIAGSIGMPALFETPKVWSN